MRVGDSLFSALKGKTGLLRVGPQHAFCNPQRGLRRWASGVGSLDTALAGGLAYGRVHEFYAAQGEDAPATAGFALALLAAMGGGEGGARATLWLRSRRAVQQAGVVQANGCAELGGRSDACLFAMIADTKELLKAAVDGLRSGALGAVVVETQGSLPDLDLTASRRLALAAEKSGTTLFLLCSGAEPVPSAAETRWRVAAAPSRALSANAPGAPVFAIELLRQRSGPCGLGWQLEWDRDRRIFTEAAAGALVSIPARRSPAAAGTGPVRLGQRAA
jgi:protein ImuA